MFLVFYLIPFQGSHRNNKGQPNSGSNRKQGGKGNGRDKKDNPPPPPTIEINSAADFPPLPPHNDHHISSSSPSVIGQIVAEPGVIPPCGYQGPYIKYSIDDILHIVSGIKDATLPSSIQLVSHCAPTL